jgi:hypothetical protein
VSLNSALTTSLIATFKWINSGWVVSGGVTADYVSGVSRVELKTNRRQVESRKDVKNSASTDSQTLTYVNPFLNAPVVNVSYEIQGGFFQTGEDLTVTNTNTVVGYQYTGSSLNVTIHSRSEGDY